MADYGEFIPHEATPQRNPRLIKRVFDAITRAEPQLGPQAKQDETTQSGVIGDATRTIWDKYFLTQNDRLAVYQDVDEMDASSEEVSTSMNTIADNVTTSEDGAMHSFQVYSKNAEVQAVLDQVCRDTRLHHNLDNKVRTLLKYGDLFDEIIVNGDGCVVALKTLDPASMQRNEDAQGRLLMGEPKYDPKSGQCLNNKNECAFDQIQKAGTDNLVATFYPWQVAHSRWNWDGVSLYGTSMLKVTRIGWKKLKASEEALILGRLIRAMMKLVFYVDTTGLSRQQKQDAVNDFKRGMLQRTQIDGKRENPFSVLTDFFIASEHYKMGSQVQESLTKIDVIDPKNDGLVQIDDIKHFHRKFLATLRVPPTYLGFEEQINAKGTVSMQDIEYVRFLRTVQQKMGHHLDQVFKLALVLADIDPFAEDNSYAIKWPPLSTTDQAAAADASYKLAQSAALALGTNSLNQTPYLSRKKILEVMFSMDEDTIERVFAEIEEDVATRQANQTEQFEEQAKIKAQYAPKGTTVVATNGSSKANGNGNGSNGGDQRNPAPHDHSGRSDPVKTASGADTSARVTEQQRVDLGELDVLVASQKELLAETIALEQMTQAMRTGDPVEVNRALATLLADSDE